MERYLSSFSVVRNLKKRTTGQDIFDTLGKYLEENGLTWKECVGVCTDGAPSMVGSIKGFVSLVKKVNSAIISTHCSFHREVLIGKTLNSDLKQVLKNVIVDDDVQRNEANYENLLNTKTR